MLKDAIDRYFYNMTTSELRLMNQKIISTDITYNSLLYLDMISYQENCTASWLAERLQVSKSAVTVKVNELIRQGLVRRIQSGEDKRVFYLEVMEAAGRMYELYDKGLLHAIETVRREFTEEEISVFCRVLNSLNDSFNEELQNEHETD